MKADIAQLKKSAVAAHRAGEHERAQQLYARYLGKCPDDAGMLSNLGALQRVLGRHQKALTLQQKAHRLKPDDPGIQTNLANILSDLGQYEASIGLRTDILKGDPNHLDHLAMIGRCHRGKGDYKAAIKHLRSALKRHPDDPELQMQLSFALLGDQNYAEAFDAYRARWQAGELTPRNLDLPEWVGQPLTGKTICVLPEQGFGDAVLFMRFVPTLKAMGATVHICAEGPVLPLFEGLEGADKVVLFDAQRIKGDYWINMMDLALIHFQQIAKVPPPAKLTIPTDSLERAQKLTAPFQKTFKIGVVWSGSETYKGNAFRSFRHNDFLPLADIPGVQLFSLYKGPGLKQFRDDGTSGIIVDAGGGDRHFGDCAAMMQQMDLIITSDTATAHIAGSLGLKTWVLLHWDPFWVWRHAGETTAWYPSVTLFRQEIPLDWAGVFGRVGEALSAEMAASNE